MDDSMSGKAACQIVDSPEIPYGNCSRMSEINENDNSEDVEAMIRVKIALDACIMSTESTSDEDMNDRDHFRKNFRKYCRAVAYQKILKQVNEYLHLHCKHSYVTDSIDIDPDRSETIRYCEKCYLG